MLRSANDEMLEMIQPPMRYARVADIWVMRARDYDDSMDYDSRSDEICCSLYDDI